MNYRNVTEMLQKCSKHVMRIALMFAIRSLVPGLLEILQFETEMMFLVNPKLN